MNRDALIWEERYRVAAHNATCHKDDANRLRWQLRDIRAVVVEKLDRALRRGESYRDWYDLLDHIDAQEPVPPSDPLPYVHRDAWKELLG